MDIQFFYENGFHGTMVSATGEAPGVNRLEIWGSKGKLTVEEGRILSFDENEVSTEEFALTNQEIFAPLPHRVRQLPLEADGIPYQQVLAAFARHLLDGSPLIADGWDGLRQVQLANAAYVSGWEERRVMLPVDNGRYLDGLSRCQRAEAGEDTGG